jgi:hypothetical protein
MQWFFERVVMGGLREGIRDEVVHGIYAWHMDKQRKKWYTARPLEQLRAAFAAGGACFRFPPLLVVHGTLDSIVPIEQSRALLAEVAHTRTKEMIQAQAKACCPDLLVELPGKRHSYEVQCDDATKAVITGTAAWLGGLIGRQSD